MISAGLDLLDEVGVRPGDERESVALIKETERISRQFEAVGVRLMIDVERFDLHREDGYGSVASMFRHHAGLSTAQARTRYRSAKMCLVLPDVEQAYRAGQIPSDNIRQLGRLFANPRVADKMIDEESWFAAQAVALRPAELVKALKTWQDLNDEDGPEPEADRCYRNRYFRHTKQFNKSWLGEHSHGSLQGVSMHEIHQHYLDAETLADWEVARAEHGENAAACHLPRTVQQRSADALFRIYQDAAANPNGAVPVGFVHNLVWNQETFEYFLAQYFGDKPDPMDPEDYLCETVDGIQVNPFEAMTSALVSKLRRAVVGAKGTVIDLGVARHFTGNARAAVKLASTTCVWPSCHVPTSKCETDHVVEHSKRGRTNPGNGAPLCGKHNRWKQKGFTIWRDAQNKWHTYRPDGSEIDP